MTPNSSRADRKLSEVAKRLAIPRGIQSSAWRDVRYTCRNDLGIEFDGWQDGTGTLLLAKKASGSIAHTVGGFGMSAMRQVGKTYFYAGAFFGMCQHYPGLLVVWSAHHSKTHNETFLSMQGFSKRPQISPYIKQVYTGSGDEAVVFNNGSRILFGARERGFGRGIPGVDVLMNDEGQILSERAVDNMLATLNTSDIGIHIYAGTPPKPEDNSEKWMRMRDEAWVIEDPTVVQTETEDLVWIEIGAPDGTAVSDIDATCEANPSWPHRTPTESIMRLIRNLKDEGIRREAQGLYDEDEGSIFDMGRWKALADDSVEMPGHAVLVCDVSPDYRWSSIAVCGEVPYGDGMTRDLIMVKTVRGLDGVAKLIAQMREERDIIDVALTPGAARALETDLTEETVEYHVLTQSEMAAAYANLQKEIRADPPKLVHLDQPELNFALANSKSRYLQTGEAQAFDRREYSVDVSSAVSAAGALYQWGMLGMGMPIIF